MGSRPVFDTDEDDFISTPVRSQQGQSQGKRKQSKSRKLKPQPRGRPKEERRIDQYGLPVTRRGASSQEKPCPRCKCTGHTHQNCKTPLNKNGVAKVIVAARTRHQQQQLHATPSTTDQVNMKLSSRIPGVDLESSPSPSASVREMSPELSNREDEPEVSNREDESIILSIKFALFACEEPYMVCIMVLKNIAELVFNVEHALVVQILSQIRADWILSHNADPNQPEEDNSHTAEHNQHVHEEDVMNTMIKYVSLYFKPDVTSSSEDEVTLVTPTADADDADTTAPSIDMTQMFDNTTRIRQWIMEGIRRWCDLLPPVTSTGIPSVSVENPSNCVICLESDFTAANAIPYPCSHCKPRDAEAEERFVHRVCWVTALSFSSICPRCRNQLNFDERTAASQEVRVIPSQDRDTLRTTDRIETALVTPYPARLSNSPSDTIGLAVKLRLLNTKRVGGGFMLSDLDIDRMTRTILSKFEAEIRAKGTEPSTTVSAVFTGHTGSDVYVACPTIGQSAVLNPCRTLNNARTGNYPDVHVHLQPLHVPERQHWVLLCQQWNKDTNSPYGYTLLQNVILDSLYVRGEFMPSVVLAARFMTLGDKAGRGTVTINPITCSQQSGGTACGLYTCAWYYLICAGLMNPFAREGKHDHPSTFEFNDHELFAWSDGFIRMGKFTMNPMVSNGYCADTIRRPPFTRTQLTSLTGRRSNKRAAGYKTIQNPGPRVEQLRALKKVRIQKRAAPTGRLPTDLKGQKTKKKKIAN